MKTAKFLTIVFLFVSTTLQAHVLRPPAEPNEVCMEAWQNYHKADVLWNAGWGLFGGGMVMVGLGTGYGIATAFGIGANPPGKSDPKLVALNRFSWSVCYIGSASVVASVPCLIIGQVRRKAALRSFAEQECESYLSCEQINAYYKQNDALWKAGWGLFGAGLGLTALGTLCVFNYSLGIRGTATNNIMQTTGFALVVIGSAATIASIPCLAVGQNRRHAARRLYNAQCADQPPLTFTLQTSANGLGLAMQF